MLAIKGMEMPSCCYECPYGHCVGSFSFCSIIGYDEIDIQEDYLAGTRYEYCPLVEIEERKAGKWLRQPSVIGLIDNVKCSCCNSNPPVMSVNVSWGWNLTNYCPNCGADMRGSENG